MNRQYSISDKKLVQQAALGKMFAFDSLYSRYAKVIYSRMRYLVPETDVEDVTQEVFIAMLSSLPSFRGEAKFSIWLRTLTNNKVTEYYSMRARKVEAMPVDLDYAEQSSDHTSVSLLEERITLQRALHYLPSQYREVILLRFAEGMQFKEIAVYFNKNTESVKALYRRAMTALAEQAVQFEDQNIEAEDQNSKIYKHQDRRSIDDQLADYTNWILERTTGDNKVKFSQDPELRVLEHTALRLRNAFIEDGSSEEAIHRIRENTVKQWQEQNVNKSTVPSKKGPSRLNHKHIEDGNYKISIAYPELLSKRYATPFLVCIYLPAVRYKVNQLIKSRFGKREKEEYIQDSILKSEDIIGLSLYSPDIDFPDAVSIKLYRDLHTTNFLGKPKDNCYPGNHPVVLSVFDPEAKTEYESISFNVEVRDFAFDHVSRPWLSQAGSLICGAISFGLYVFTLLGQIDKAVGLASGTVAGAIATAIFMRFHALYKQPDNITTP